MSAETNVSDLNQAEDCEKWERFSGLLKDEPDQTVTVVGYCAEKYARTSFSANPLHWVEERADAAQEAWHSSLEAVDGVRSAFFKDSGTISELLNVVVEPVSE